MMRLNSFVLRGMYRQRRTRRGTYSVAVDISMPARTTLQFACLSKSAKQFALLFKASMQTEKLLPLIITAKDLFSFVCNLCGLVKSRMGGTSYNFPDLRRNQKLYYIMRILPNCTRSYFILWGNICQYVSAWLEKSKILFTWSQKIALAPGFREDVSISFLHPGALGHVA